MQTNGANWLLFCFFDNFDHVAQTDDRSKTVGRHVGARQGSAAIPLSHPTMMLGWCNRPTKLQGQWLVSGLTFGIFIFVWSRVALEVRLTCGALSAVWRTGVRLQDLSSATAGEPQLDCRKQNTPEVPPSPCIPLTSLPDSRHTTQPSFVYLPLHPATRALSDAAPSTRTELA
jgi:hypothetical protein